MRPAVQDRAPGRPTLRAVTRIAHYAGGTPAVRLLLCALVLALGLAGCGKRNAPQPPPDAPDTFPRPYPSE